MIRGLAPMPAGVIIDGLVRLLAASRKILFRSTKYDAKLIKSALLPLL